MEKSLQMTFLNGDGKNVSISISGVKEGITTDEIKTVMGTIIAKNIFTTTGGELKSVVSANLVSREVEKVTVK